MFRIYVLVAGGIALGRVLSTEECSETCGAR
jgi:hypothetical protein